MLFYYKECIVGILSRKTNWSLIAVLTLMFLKDSNKGVNLRYLKTHML